MLLCKAPRDSRKSANWNRAGRGRGRGGSAAGHPLPRKRGQWAAQTAGHSNMYGSSHSVYICVCMYVCHTHMCTCTHVCDTYIHFCTFAYVCNGPYTSAINQLLNVHEPPWVVPGTPLGLAKRRSRASQCCSMPCASFTVARERPDAQGLPSSLAHPPRPAGSLPGGGGGPCGQERQAHDAVPLHAAELRPQRGAFRRHGLPVVRRGATAGGAVGRRGGWGWRRGRKVGLGPSHVSWLSPVWRPAKEVGGGTFWRRPHAPHPQILTRLIDENLPNGNIGL